MKYILVLFLLLIFACKNSELQTEPIQDEVNDQPLSGVINFPLDNYSVTQDFGNKNNLFSSKYHCAEDVTASGGTRVKAITDGIVSYSGPMGGYGWLITIDHESDSVYSLYGHLSTKREKVSKGDTVKAGQIIAYIGDDDEDGSGPRDGSGRYPYWTPHLHFSIRKGKTTDYPGDGDKRWMAGYTEAHPTDIGWLDPENYINSRK